MNVYCHLKITLFAIMLALTDPAIAAEPCVPFEGGKVNADVLQAMRQAAREGRLYRIVPGRSRVGFCVRYFPFKEFRGEFSNIVGGLALPPDIDKHGQALLLIHTASMEPSTPALAPLVHSHQFMDTERFPEILFVGRAFQWVDHNHAHIFGDITLRGITQPVMFEIEIDVQDDPEHDRPGRIYLRGTGQVNRSHFDMRSHRFTVNETVRLCLDVELTPWGRQTGP